MLEKSKEELLEARIRSLHDGDDKQLEVIFSSFRRILVEAPAGYGKTRTMISRLAYLLATNQVPNPKKILALTFSVNAASKVKKDVADQLPSLIDSNNSSHLSLNKKLLISNYHGFCRHILGLYGYLLHPSLKDIDILDSVDDSDIEKLTNSLSIPYRNAQISSNFSDAVKQVNTRFVRRNLYRYNRSIISHFLEQGLITFNSIITLTIQILTQFSEILEFYRNYFPIIIIDEFQDTNILSWLLLKKLISDETKLLFMGDSLQRIYGFIGAIPNLLPEAMNEYEMKLVQLSKNYRFKDNLQMLKLDKNIRANAENLENPIISESAEVPFLYAKNQQEESNKIVHKIIDLMASEEGRNDKVAVLTKQRGSNINGLIKLLKDNGIPYFYGLFGDDDLEYVKFHKECDLKFRHQMTIDRKISRSNLNSFFKEVEASFEASKTPTVLALLDLLEVFLDRVINVYYFLEVNEKILLINETFENRTLKQNIEYLDQNLIVSTIHGAKGLEWDYVIIPDVEQYTMPNWYGLCGECQFKRSCNIEVARVNQKKLLEELSVFYVGLTRARKQVFFSASKTRLNSQGQVKSANISCLLKLPGISLVSGE